MNLDAESTHSWTENADAWIAAVRGGQIESRRAVTDGAIVAKVVACQGPRVLDVGCGEGWLARALAARGLEVTGVDASASLVAAAHSAGGGRFLVASYEELARQTVPLPPSPFDVAVFNFSLLTEAVSPVLQAVRRAVRPGGRLVIQTVHPLITDPAQPYTDGWRVEDFAGMGGGFSREMPWYFRTIGSWVREVRAAGWRLESIDEPLHPETRRPASLLLIART
ncbi:MAG: class I SAM-dependent methyltransferase [Bacteroidota bacterium]